MIKNAKIKIHKEDKAIIIDFIDYARLYRKENVNLEISARYVASFLGISPDMSNKRLANRFTYLLESNLI